MLEEGICQRVCMSYASPVWFFTRVYVYTTNVLASMQQVCAKRLCVCFVCVYLCVLACLHMLPLAN
jgi:hypothetical protein